MSQRVYAALAAVVVASPLPEAAWYSAAEAALTALYALHPAPEHLSAAILRHLARAAFAPAAEGQGAAAGEEASVQQGEGAAAGAEEGDEVEQGGEAMEADGSDAPDAAEEEGGEGGVAPAASEQGSLAPGSQVPRSLHSVPALSRFFFALGHVALQHLVRCQATDMHPAAPPGRGACDWFVQAACRLCSARACIHPVPSATSTAGVH